MSQTEQPGPYRRLFEEAPIAYHEVDAGGIIRRVNRAECELMGMSADQILGHPSWDFVVPHQRAFLEQRVHAVLAGAKPSRDPVEFDAVRADGTCRTLAVYASLIEDENGKLVGIRSAQLDITALKQSGLAREEQRRIAQLHADLMGALATGSSIANSLQRCCEAVVRNLDADFARIWIVDPAQSMLELQASAGLDANLDAATIPIGPAGIDLQFLQHACAKREGVPGITAYPMLVDEKKVGVLAMFSRTPATPAVAEALNLAAQEIAVGIERKRASEALRSSEAQYRRMLETAAEGIWIGDSKSRATFVNQRMAEMLGYESDQLIGRSAFDFIPLEDQATIGVLLNSVTSGNKESFEYALTRADGSHLWVNVCCAPIFDENGALTGMLAMLTDIDQRRRAEDALRVSEEFNKGIVESTQDGILVLDVSGRCQYLSPAAGKLLETASGELQCFSLLDFWDDPTRERLEAALRTAVGGSSSFAGTCSTAKGSTRRLEMSFSPIRDASRVNRLVAVIRDITERSQLEAQLLQALKLESIGQLAAGVAHEINTPIQYVGDNARFLQDAFGELRPMIALERLAAEHRGDVEYLCEEIPKALEQLLEGVGQVARIVRAMKEFSHPGPPEKTPVDLNRAMQSTIMVCRNEWKYVADLVEDFAPDLPPVHCVPGEINQVVLNLVVNAAHAIADVVAVKGAKGTITVSTRLDGDTVEIRVRDTGTGIPDAIRAKIFDPFFTTKEVGKGTGQGLSIAHTVVFKNHGGTIHFETEPGAGTTFIVRLPVGPATGAL